MRLRSPKNKLVGPVEVFNHAGFDPYKHNIFAIDTETTGLNPWRDEHPDRPFMFTLCDGDGHSWSIRWAVDPTTRAVICDNKSFKLLSKYLSDPKLEKVFHHFSYDIKMLKLSGFAVNGKCHDTMIRMKVISPAEPSVGLKPLCEKYLNIPTDDEKDLHKSTVTARGAAKKKGWLRSEDVKGDYYLADHKICRRYALLDAERTMALFAMQEEYFKEKPNLQTVNEREHNLMLTLNRSEERGIRIDIKRTKDIIAYYDEQIDRSKQFIQKEAGKDFNPNSWQQKQKLFFGDIGYKPLEYSRKGKSKTYSDCMHCKGAGCKICQNTGRSPKCDGAFLENIALRHVDDASVVVLDELAHALLYHSAASTMRGYAESYLKYSSKESENVTVIHPNFRQTGPVTGRLSAYNPNTQNVADDDSGKKKVDIAYRLRECYIPRDGHWFYMPDYSQIEIWILALCANATNLLQELAAGGDAHQVVFDMMSPNAYDKDLVREAESLPPEKRTKAHIRELHIKKQGRKNVKALNFGIIYGQGDELTAKSMGVSLKESREFRRMYHERFPEIGKFMAQSIRHASRYGMIINPYGRELPVDKRLAYRATNYMIQGTAAELMKNAMVYVDQLSINKFNDEIRLLLNIHDELIIEVPNKHHSKETAILIEKEMVRDYKFLKSPVPFSVGFAITNTRWSESQKWNLTK